MRTTPYDTVRCRFFAPVELALHDVSSTRLCPQCSDEEFVASGIGQGRSDGAVLRLGQQQIARHAGEEEPVRCVLFMDSDAPRRIPSKKWRELIRKVWSQITGNCF